MYLEFPVCWPTAKALDLLLGSEHSHLYRRNELKTLIELHSMTASHLDTVDSEERLSEIEVGVVRAALGMKTIRVDECMKDVTDVVTVSDGMRICDVDIKQVRWMIVFHLEGAES